MLNWSNDKYLILLDLLKSRVKRIPESFSDADILTFIEEVEQYILNYCMIPEVPYQLRFVWADLTADYTNYQIEKNTKPEDVMDAFDPSDVSSIKVGDTNIQMGDKYRSNERSRTLNSHQPNLDAFVMNYKSQLNRFRRLWY